MNAQLMQAGSRRPEEVAAGMLGRVESRVVMLPEDFEREAVALAHAMRHLPATARREMPVRHFWMPGVYVRQIFMPAGTTVVGEKHKTEHLNVILSGRARVLMNGASVHVQGGDTVLSKVGVRKVLQILEDCEWQTIHHNPDDCRDVEELERRLVDHAATEAADPEDVKRAAAVFGIELSPDLEDKKP